MAKKGETRLQRSIQRALKKEFHCWFFKVHGGPFQQSGIPDLMGCCAGLFFALEVKKPKGKTSVIQKETIRDIKRKGGGFATVVITPKEAVEFVRKVLRKEGRLLEGSKTIAAARRRLRERSAQLGSTF